MRRKQKTTSQKYTPAACRYINGIEYVHYRTYKTKKDATNAARRERNRCKKCSARVIKSTKPLKIYSASLHRYVYKFQFHVYVNVSNVLARQ